VFIIAGNEDGLTTAQRVLIDRTIILIGVCRCIEEWVSRTGVFVNGEMEPSLSERRKKDGKRNKKN
jgi:hypothetical protein